MIKRLAFLMVAIISINIAAEELHYYPTPENLERRKEFADAKFGIFIHWGIYSMMGDGEWVMTNQDIKPKRASLHSRKALASAGSPRPRTFSTAASRGE